MRSALRFKGWKSRKTVKDLRSGPERVADERSEEAKNTRRRVFGTVAVVLSGPSVNQAKSREVTLHSLADPPTPL